MIDDMAYPKTTLILIAGGMENLMAGDMVIQDQHLEIEAVDNQGKDLGTEERVKVEGQSPPVVTHREVIHSRTVEVEEKKPVSMSK